VELLEKLKNNLEKKKKNKIKKHIVNESALSSFLGVKFLYMF